MGAWVRGPLGLRAVAERWIACWNGSDSRRFADLFAEEGSYVEQAFLRRKVGRDAIREHHALWREAVPDFRLTAKRVLPSGDDHVIVEFSTDGTLITDAGEAEASLVDGNHPPTCGLATAILDVDGEGRIKRCVEYYVPKPVHTIGYTTIR